MTKEELEKEAEERANKRCHEIMCYGHCSFNSPKHHRCGEWHREYNCAKEGIEFGFNKANEWHNLQENPTDLPKCGEDEQIIFYVKEWYENISKYRNHYCLGFYKKAFLNDDVKVFVEKSKGYENEHLPATVLRWRVLEKWEIE